MTHDLDNDHEDTNTLESKKGGFQCEIDRRAWKINTEYQANQKESEGINE